MPRTTWPTLLLLACAACGHQQAATSKAPPVQSQLAIRQGQDPGTLGVVPVQPAHEGPKRTDAARPSMALGQETHGQASPETLPHDDGKPARKESGSELRLRERIQSTLARRSSLSYSAKRVSVAVQRQDVVLTGDVPTEREKGDVQAIVEQIDGVRRVSNRLVVVAQPEQAEALP